MSFVGPFICEMGDQEYWCYQEKCSRLAVMLSRTIDTLMHYIFEGRTRNAEEWESLFKAINQAVLMKEYLDRNCANLLTIAEDFLAQACEWQREVETHLN